MEPEPTASCAPSRISHCATLNLDFSFHRSAGRRRDAGDDGAGEAGRARERRIRGRQAQAGHRRAHRAGCEAGMSRTRNWRARLVRSRRPGVPVVPPGSGALLPRRIAGPALPRHDFVVLTRLCGSPSRIQGQRVDFPPWPAVILAFDSNNPKISSGQYKELQRTNPESDNAFPVW